MTTPSGVIDVNAPLRDNFVRTIATSAGIVAALQWNEALRSLFQTGGAFSHAAGRIYGPWVMAVLATLFAYFVNIAVARWTLPKEQGKCKYTPTMFAVLMVALAFYIFEHFK